MRFKYIFNHPRSSCLRFPLLCRARSTACLYFPVSSSAWVRLAPYSCHLFSPLYPTNERIPSRIPRFLHPAKGLKGKREVPSRRNSFSGNRRQWVVTLPSRSHRAILGGFSGFCHICKIIYDQARFPFEVLFFGYCFDFKRLYHMWWMEIN